MIESCKLDGEFRTSKTLWALGNYSFFVRPGMVRISQINNGISQNAADLMASAYVDNLTKKVVVVLINYSDKNKAVDLTVENLPKSFHSRFALYETSSRSDLQLKGWVGSRFSVPSRSVVTLVSM